MAPRLAELPITGRHLFAATAALLVALLTVALLGLAWALHNQNRDAMVSHLDLAERLFQARLASVTETLQIVVEGLDHDPRLAALFAQRRRAALQRALSARFDHLKSDHGVTQLTFLTPDRKVLLRAHAPDRHGDRVDRTSLLWAESGGESESGIEIGPLGMMALRVVSPWRWRGERIGYIEIGSDIVELARGLRLEPPMSYAVFVDKQRLEAIRWPSPAEAPEAERLWQRYRALVEIGPGPGLGLPAALLDDRAAWIEEAGKVGYSVIEAGERQRALRWVSIMNPAGDAIGAFALTLDITEAQHTALRNAALLALGVVALGSALALLFWRVSRHAESETRRADMATRTAFAELERQVEERTTALRAANESLRSSESQLRIITDSLPVLIAFIDKDFGYRFLNRTAASWLSVSAEEAIGHSVRSVHSPENFEKLRPHMEAVVDGIPQAFDLSIGYPDGKVREVHLTFVPSRGDNGEVLGFFSLVEDQTERLATEAQLRQIQKMEAVGQLTGGIAHDFNNLLAVIMGNADLLRGRLVEQDETVRLLDMIVGASERGARLCQQLLAFARRQPLRAQTVDVRALVQGMAGLMQRSLGESIEIRVRHAPDLWTCRVDPTWLEQALLNLVINARDAMPGGGRVVIETLNVGVSEGSIGGEEGLAAGDYVALVVTDSGQGLSTEIQERIFEPFFTTKVEGRGSGLGLSMVYGFAQQSGGRVSVSSVEGRGSSFRLMLPRGGAVAAPVAAEPEPARGSEGTETVLLVEDEPEVRALVEGTLRSLGYRVVEAATGEEALAALEGAPPIDLLLSDVVLSRGMSGPELAERLRRDNPGLRVLYMSGYAADAVFRGGSMPDDAGLISKPFHMTELARRVRAVLDQEPPLAAVRSA